MTLPPGPVGTASVPPVPHGRTACRLGWKFLPAELRALIEGRLGGSVVDAGPGDFVFVPKRLIHREANPGEDRSELLGVRVGEGETLVNVDGPDDR